MRKYTLATVEMLALVDPAVATKVVLSKVTLLARKNDLSSSESQSPRWLVTKTMVLFDEEALR